MTMAKNMIKEITYLIDMDKKQKEIDKLNENIKKQDKTIEYLHNKIKNQEAKIKKQKNMIETAAMIINELEYARISAESLLTDDSSDDYSNMINHFNKKCKY